MECLIIGGGPAGLTAAIYLARFRRKFCLIDAGSSRAGWIPMSHNHAGFPEGISGEALLERMRAQAARYGCKVRAGTVRQLERLPDGRFRATTESGSWISETVLLATGAEDIEPDLPDLEKAIQRGFIRHCPICDAYEVIGRKVAVIGYGNCSIHEALLLRRYTDDLSLLTLGKALQMPAREQEALRQAGVRIIDDPIEELSIERDRIAAWRMTSGRTLHFDAIYTALGLRIRSELAEQLSARHDDDGALLVDAHQQTSVPGLFAAGDVVSSLTQISVAMGHAAVAATAINNRLPLSAPPV